MPDIDIPVDVDLKDAFNLPDCTALGFPEPAKLSIQLPTGGSVTAVNLANAIPNDCTLSFSLMVQLAPLLAAMECIVKILNLLKPLIDVIQGLPVPPVKAIQEFAKAAIDLAPCLLIPTPASIIPFVRDILCLILKILKCFLGQMKTVLGVMQGLSLQLNTANSIGNGELVSTLECAQDNAQKSAAHLMQSIEPVGVILNLVGPFMGIAGLKPIQLPALGSETDIDSLNQVIQTVQGLVGTIQIAVDTIGGCPS